MSITFVLLSYNHEKYISQTLDSIYNQEEKYGRGQEIQLIIADDASSDCTFQIENEWVDSHKDCFKDILLLPSDQHKGINKNYIRALNYVTEDYFRGLAGDDLLADFDIINKLTDADLHIFSYFTFRDYHLDYKLNDVTSPYCSYLFWNEDFKKMKKYSKIIFPVSLHGMVFKKSLINQRLLFILNQYEYLEDRPLWDCFMELENANIKYINSPITLRRISHTSISNIKSSNEFHEAFLLNRISYWKNKRRNIKNSFDKISITIYLIKLQFPQFRFIRYFFPYNYLRLYKMISKGILVRQLATELDDKYYVKNQVFLKSLEDGSPKQVTHE